jgi:hypothetical protein
MKYGMIGGFIKFTFAKTAFDYIQKEIPAIDMATYKPGALGEYRAIVERTPGIGSMKENMFVMTMYAGAFLIALYKTADGKIDEEKLKGLIYALSYCPLMVKAKQGKSAFTEKEIANRTKQAQRSRDHIEEYPMNWYYYFKTVPGKDEYYITHKGFVQICFGCVHFHLDSCHNSDLLIDRFFTEKSIGQTLLTEITKTA